MNDLISRQAAIQEIDDLPNCYNGYSDTYDKAYIIGVLEELPTIDPVKHGKWIEEIRMISSLNGEIRKARECSECGSRYFVYDDSENTIDVIPNYCPNCGARMDL